MYSLITEKEAKNLNPEQINDLQIKKRKDVIENFKNGITEVVNTNIFTISGMNKANKIGSILVQFKKESMKKFNPKSIIAFVVRIHFLDSEIIVEDTLTNNGATFRYKSFEDTKRCLLATKQILFEAQKEKGYLDKIRTAA